MRITRALFDIVLRRNNPVMAGRFLILSKMLELQQWDSESPMRQFRILPFGIIEKIEARNMSVEDIREMDVKELGTFYLLNVILFYKLACKYILILFNIRIFSPNT